MPSTLQYCSCNLVEVPFDIKAYGDPANEQELLVLGGQTVFQLFMPLAHRVDVALVNELVPGDLLLEGWDNGQFSLERAVP